LQASPFESLGGLPGKLRTPVWQLPAQQPAGPAGQMSPHSPANFNQELQACYMACQIVATTDDVSLWSYTFYIHTMQPGM